MSWRRETYDELVDDMVATHGEWVRPIIARFVRGEPDARPTDSHRDREHPSDPSPPGPGDRMVDPL